MKRLLLVILVLVAVSCDTENPGLKTIDFGEFTIQVPEAWHGGTDIGYDSFVGHVKINSNEEIGFDLGWWSNQLNVATATHHIEFTRIDNKPAKVVRPKNFKKGTTGVFFDSLERTRTVRFEMSGSKLSPRNQKLFLEAIKTIKFKNY